MFGLVKRSAEILVIGPVIALGMVCFPLSGTEVSAYPACVDLFGGRILETTVKLYALGTFCQLIERFFGSG